MASYGLVTRLAPAAVALGASRKNHAKGEFRKFDPSSYRRYGKRAFDVAFSLLLLPFVGPIILAMWVLVRRDGGPGFYTQRRVGLDGRQFECLKIRTMAVNADQILKQMIASDPEVAAEWARDQKLAKDPRITRVGRFARATSLDELPQIINVLRGDMSFVGPRPFTVDQELMYRAAGGDSYYRLRPGITGIWQIEGRSASAFVDRIKYDNAYDREVGLGRDLGLILKTVGVVFEGTGT